jgi:hypothetical protein
MVVLAAWIAAVAVALLALAALALGLAGHLRRFTDTLRTARRSTAPALAELARALPRRPPERGRP